MSFIQSCGERGKKSARGRRRSRDEKGNQGVRDFRFINILQLFSIYFFFELLYFITFFFYAFFLPTKFTHTHTHYPRPTTFSYTPKRSTIYHIQTLIKIQLYSMSLADPGRQLITFMDQQSKLHVYPNISNSFVPGRNRCPVIFKSS